MEKHYENSGESFQSLLAESEEYDIFKTDSVQEGINYQW